MLVRFALTAFLSSKKWPTCVNVHSFAFWLSYERDVEGCSKRVPFRLNKIKFYPHLVFDLRQGFFFNVFFRVCRISYVPQTRSCFIEINKFLYVIFVPVKLLCFGCRCNFRSFPIVCHFEMKWARQATRVHIEKNIRNAKWTFDFDGQILEHIRIEIPCRPTCWYAPQIAQTCHFSLFLQICWPTFLNFLRNVGQHFPSFFLRQHVRAQSARDVGQLMLVKMLANMSGLRPP